MDKQIVFRRINGRIVPIRKHEHDLSLGKVGAGAALVGSAIGIAEGAGALAHMFQRKSAVIEDAARTALSAEKFGQMNLFNGAAAGKLFKQSSKLHGARNFALLGGALVGGALIAGAIAQSRKKTTKETSLQDAGTGFALASTLSGASYYRRLAPFGKGFASLKEAVKLAKSRNTLQYILKGI